MPLNYTKLLFFFCSIYLLKPHRQILSILLIKLSTLNWNIVAQLYIQFSEAIKAFSKYQLPFDKFEEEAKRYKELEKEKLKEKGLHKIEQEMLKEKRLKKIQKTQKKFDKKLNSLADSINFDTEYPIDMSSQMTLNGWVYVFTALVTSDRDSRALVNSAVRRAREDSEKNVFL